MATKFPFPTINVVPAGYRWTQDAAMKAAAKGAFLRVGGPQVTRRYLSGVKRSWTSTNPEENQTIFHTGYRITGTPEAVETALTYAGVDPDEIRRVLDTAITRDNYDSTHAEEVAVELQRHTQAKTAKPVTEGYEPSQILWFAMNIKHAVIATKTGEQKGGVASPGRGGAGDTLADKIKKLGHGKVLDVSNMDINTGKGVRSVPAPKTAKSGKFGTASVPIISNDLNKYIRAIQLAYGADGETQYANDIQVVRQALNAVGVPIVGNLTQTTKVTSPVIIQQGATIQPGATIASPPIFTPKTLNQVPLVATPARLNTTGGQGYPTIPQLTGLFQPQ